MRQDRCKSFKIRDILVCDGNVNLDADVAGVSEMEEEVGKEGRDNGREVGELFLIREG